MHRLFASLLFITSIAFTSFDVYATATTDAAKKMAEAALTENKMTPTPIPKLSNEERLATMLPSDEVMWLTDDSGKFLALQRDYLAATHRGVAIFISDLSAPINYNLDIEPLRKAINQYGWSSLTINAPSMALFNPVSSAKSEKLANSDEPKASDAPVEKPMNGNALKAADAPMEKPVSNNDQSRYAKALIERVISAQKSANLQSKNVVLVIQGRQVAYLTDALIQQHLRPLKAVVVIDAKTALYDSNMEQYPSTEQALSQQLAQIRMPLLDIYHLAHERTLKQMSMRMKLSKKEKQKVYRQYLKSTYSEEHQLAKIVYGWLKKLDED